MTLYRIDLDRLAAHSSSVQMAGDLRALGKTRVLVPVDPCDEHDKYDQHVVRSGFGLGASTILHPGETVCPGAGLEDTK